jgi:hypothetical protein
VNSEYQDNGHCFFAFLLLQNIIFSPGKAGADGAALQGEE